MIVAHLSASPVLQDRTVATVDLDPCIHLLPGGRDEPGNVVRLVVISMSFHTVIVQEANVDQRHQPAHSSLCLYCGPILPQNGIDGLVSCGRCPSDRVGVEVLGNGLLSLYRMSRLIFYY